MADGTIYDLAYKRYEGGRTSTAYRWTVIARAAMQMQMRQWWVKALMVLALPLLSFWVLLLASSEVLGAVQGNAHSDVAVGSYGISAQGITTFLLLLVTGAPAIAADLNAGAFQFYFARPVSPGQYLAGRVAGSAAWSLLLALGSLAVLALVRVALGGAVTAVALVLFKAVGPLILRVLAVTSVALGVSSVTRRRGLAQAMYAGVVIASALLTRTLAYAKDAPWIRWLDVTGGSDALGEQALGSLHVHGWRAALPAGSTAVWIMGFLALAVWRLQRAEVVRG